MSLDRPAPGIQIAQPKRGFRYGSEAFWLTGFALEGEVPTHALDLGTGSGIAALLLAGVGVQTTGIDVRPEWEELWEQTLRASEVTATLQVVDVLEIEGRWPLIISNPPFFAAGSGPVAPDPWKAAARTESTATLAQFVSCARDLLEPDGRACFVIPIERLEEISDPTRIARVGERRVLVEFGRERGSCVEDVALGEDDPRVVGWYARVGAHNR